MLLIWIHFLLRCIEGNETFRVLCVTFHFVVAYMKPIYLMTGMLYSVVKDAASDSADSTRISSINGKVRKNFFRLT